jgi:hypothetical protein
MLDSCYTGNKGHEILPTFLFGAKGFAALGCEAVIAAAALLGFFDPASGDPTFLFEAVEERVEGSDVEFESAAGAELDELGDIVAVAGLVFEEGEHEELGAAFFPIGVGRGRHIFVSPLYGTQ